MSSSIDIFFSVLINIANVIGIIYNIPQMVHTYRRKKADDISALFLNLRTLCSAIWIVYSIYYELWYVLISFASSLISSLFISYYRFEYLRTLLLMIFNKKKELLPNNEIEIKIKPYSELIDINIDNHNDNQNDDNTSEINTE